MHNNRRQTARPLQWNEVLGENVQKRTLSVAKSASRGAKIDVFRSNSILKPFFYIVLLVVRKKRRFFTSRNQGLVFRCFLTPPPPEMCQRRLSPGGCP